MKNSIRLILVLIVFNISVSSKTVVRLSLPSNCSASTAVIENNYVNAYQIDIYPNPNKGIFQLNAVFKNRIGHVTITIFDGLGKVQYCEEVFCNSTNFVKPLHLRKIGKGSYYLLVKSATQEAATKLIINN
jgi:hypothetical protein